MSNRAARDEGLRRVSALTRWTAAGAIVTAGALSAIAAKAIPGKKASATPAGATEQSQPPPSVTGADANQGDGALAPPVQLPARTGGRGSVVSGAS
jgi:hypothetical protein